MEDSVLEYAHGKSSLKTNGTKINKLLRQLKIKRT